MIMLEELLIIILVLMFVGALIKAFQHPETFMKIACLIVLVAMAFTAIAIG